MLQIEMSPVCFRIQNLEAGHDEDKKWKELSQFFYKNENVTTELPFSLTVHVGGMGLYYPSSQ